MDKNMKWLIPLIAIVILGVVVANNPDVFKFQAVSNIGKWHHCDFGLPRSYCCEITSNYISIPSYDIFNTKDECEAGLIGPACFPDQNAANVPLTLNIREICAAYGCDADLLSTDTWSIWQCQIFYTPDCEKWSETYVIPPTEINYLCKSTMFNGQSMYCELGEMEKCPNGCKNNACVGEPSECFSYESKCEGNTLYKCTNGKWAIDKACASGQTCTEQSTQGRSASCVSPPPAQFCWSPTSQSCVECSSGYATEELCINSNRVCACKVSNTSCVKKTGADCGKADCYSTGSDSGDMDECIKHLPQPECQTENQACGLGLNCCTDAGLECKLVLGTVSTTRCVKTGGSNQTRGQICSITAAFGGSDSDCGANEVCVADGNGGKRCYDIDLDKCLIGCSSQGNVLTPASCSVDYCHSMSCYVRPTFVGGVVSSVKAADCVDCIGGPGRMDKKIGEASCCSKKAVGDVCTLGKVITDNAVSTKYLVPTTTYANVEGMTSQNLLRHACIYDEDCQGQDKDTSIKCRSLQSLIADEYITEAQKTNFYDTFKPVVTDALFGMTTGTLLGSVACYAFATAMGTVSGGVGTAAVVPICTGLVVGSAGVGLTLGGTYGYGSVALVDSIKNADASKTGVCIAGTGGKAGDFCSWFDFLKQALPENAKQYSCLIGIIFIVIVILALIAPRR